MTAKYFRMKLITSQSYAFKIRGAGLLLGVDMHDVGAVGLRQHHTDAVRHQLSAELRIRGGVDLEPDGVALCGIQTFRAEQVAGPAAAGARDDGNRSVGGFVVTLNDVGRAGAGSKNVKDLTRGNVEPLILIELNLILEEA